MVRQGVGYKRIPGCGGRVAAAAAFPPPGQAFSRNKFLKSVHEPHVVCLCHCMLVTRAYSLSKTIVWICSMNCHRMQMAGKLCSDQ